MATADQALRERIRRNVGYPTRALAFHAPAATADPWIVQPTPRIPPTPGVPGPLPGLNPVDGRSYVITMVVLAAAREIQVTPRLGFPFQLRKINLAGDLAATDAVSFRILVSDDNDTTPTADPTGSDVYDISGDPIGAEDPGMHAALNAGTVVLEPWTLVLAAGKYLKLKVHNTAAGAKLIAAFFDLDMLQ